MESKKNSYPHMNAHYEILNTCHEVHTYYPKRKTTLIDTKDPRRMEQSIFKTIVEMAYEMQLIDIMNYFSTRHLKYRISVVLHANTIAIYYVWNDRVFNSDGTSVAYMVRNKGYQPKQPTTEYEETAIIPYEMMHSVRQLPDSVRYQVGGRKLARFTDGITYQYQSPALLRANPWIEKNPMTKPMYTNPTKRLIKI